MKKIHARRPSLQRLGAYAYDSDELEVIDNEPWKKDFEADELLGRYEPIHTLGGGAYGVVYEGKTLKQMGKLEKGKQIAIKKLRRIFHTETDAKRTFNELRVLYTLRKHDNIMRLYDIIPPKEPRTFATLTLIFEFVDADLKTLLRTNQFFTILHIQYILYQILLGVQSLHSLHIAHRDMKPSAIYINEDCSVKIGDFDKTCNFGENDDELLIDYDKKQKEIEFNCLNNKKKKKQLFKKKKVERRICRQVITRKWYISPQEILLEHKSSTLPACDIWSIGCIFGVLLQMQRENRPDPTRRRLLFPGDKCFSLLEIRDEWRDEWAQAEQMQVIFDVIGSPDETEINNIRGERARKYVRDLAQTKKKSLKRLFPGADKNALDLLRRMLKFDVDKRITMKEALKHKYFEGIREMKVEQMRKKIKDGLLELCGYETMVIGQKAFRSFILQEVLKYNKYEEKRFMRSGVMVNYKLDVVLDGYIRKYIEPLFYGKFSKIIIPMSVIAVCYRYLTY